jgi:alkylation response protein AidB-like acyl-CoA dehydrogenase
MEFGFSEEQNLLRQSVQDFAKKECPPDYVEEMDRKREFRHELRKKIADMGWFGTCVPEEYGGSARGMIDIAILLEEQGRAGIACDFIPTAIFAVDAMRLHGSEEQKKFFLPKIAAGELIFAISFTEPNAGSDIAALTTTADLDGDHFVINGHKMWTSILDVADYVMMAARTDKTVKKHKGLSLFIVDTKTPGITMKEIDKLGGHVMPSFEVFYENLRIPKDALLGELNKGFYQVISIVNTERIGISAYNVGAARAVLDYALRYVSEREQFGQPIGKFQAIQHKLANLAMEIEAARLLTYNAAWLEEQGPSMDSHLKATMAKLKSSEIYKQATIDGMQVMGGYGYAMEYPMQRWYREAVLQTVDIGPSEIQLSTIAFMLGMPR